MNAQDVISRLFSAKGVTYDRILKAKGMASRLRIDWLDVIIAMTPEQRKEVENVGAR